MTKPIKRTPDLQNTKPSSGKKTPAKVNPWDRVPVNMPFKEKKSNPATSKKEIRNWGSGKR